MSLERLLKPDSRPVKSFPGPLILRVADGQFSSCVENVRVVEFNPGALVPAFVAWCSENVNNLCQGHAVSQTWRGKVVVIGGLHDPGRKENIQVPI